jgi:hypothetical protein
MLLFIVSDSSVDSVLELPQAVFVHLLGAPKLLFSFENWPIFTLHA